MGKVKLVLVFLHERVIRLHIEIVSMIGRRIMIMIMGERELDFKHASVCVERTEIICVLSNEINL